MANGSHSRQPTLDNCTSWGQYWALFRLLERLQDGQLISKPVALSSSPE